MITSQVYPQARLPSATRTVTRQQSEEMEPESGGTFAKGTNQAIGSFQILLGMGILGTLCVAVVVNVLSLPSIVMSLTASIVHMTNGVVSCSRWRCMVRVKLRPMVIRVAIITNVLGAVTALISAIIYSLSFRLWRQDGCLHPHDCSYLGNPTLALTILLFLSILELGFAVLTTLYAWKDLDHIEPDLPSSDQPLPATTGRIGECPHRTILYLPLPVPFWFHRTPWPTAARGGGRERAGVAMESSRESPPPSVFRSLEASSRDVSASLWWFRPNPRFPRIPSFSSSRPANFVGLSAATKPTLASVDTAILQARPANDPTQQGQVVSQRRMPRKNRPVCLSGVRRPVALRFPRLPAFL
ncbi:hypothetical protein AAFF_G00169940 [Aldrovandia affinis]|uniref:Uncharacterized protein n=1 Tax=Aldrovandia affinis TaxID=143900 RepID=A0AAD7RLR8_9TELE|nr:hypothetical protein AAFF_G00169940 [Aldrovandia affinis]